MKNYGQVFLNELAGLPPGTFESRFSTSSTALGLGAILDRNELTLLYEAAFCAGLCHHAINGLGEYEGKINAEGEPNRMKLESEFLVARDILFASAGWQTLSTSAQNAIQERFLSVSVRRTSWLSKLPVAIVGSGLLPDIGARNLGTWRLVIPARKSMLA